MLKFNGRLCGMHSNETQKNSKMLMKLRETMEINEKRNHTYKHKYETSTSNNLIFNKKICEYIFENQVLSSILL